MHRPSHSQEKNNFKFKTPENGWTQCQNPAGTLDDPVIEKQTSTDHKTKNQISYFKSDNSTYDIQYKGFF